MRTSSGRGISRRSWLVGTLAAWWAGAALGDVRGLDADDERELEQIRDLARKLGVGPLHAVEPTEHYLGVGDASEPFITEALNLCEGLASDYLAYFQKKGFAVKPPRERLSVVALADARSFAAFTGVEEGSAVGGIYDIQTNRLVIFDNRSRGGPQGARANSVSLFHEATHQLTYNTGLLDRRGDVPLCITEGLGMVGEVRRPRNLGRFGDRNIRRINDVLVPTLRQGRPLIPLRTLFEDEVFDDPRSEQLAYAQSWLLVDVLLRDAELLPKFRSYLQTIQPRRDGRLRIQDVEATLGDLDVLERKIRNDAINASRR